MGLSNQERINFNSKVLAANVQDGVPSKQWYEGMRPNFFILEDGQILTQFDTVRANPAGSLTQARTNAAGPLAGIIEDLSQSSSAIRLTEDIASNGFQYIALSTYNDFSADRLDKWVQPQKVPQSNGQPSIGYSIQLYNGDPASGGTLINTSDGQTGSGNTASVGWVFNYDTGTLLLSEDFKSSISDPYIVGFRYIGDTVATGLADHYHERIYFNATQTAHGFSLGPQVTPVYHSSSGWHLACADSNETIALAIVTNVPDENTLEITLHGRVTVIGHGLSLYQYYFLSQTTPGTVDSAYPTTGISQPLLWVEDANTIIVHRERATEEVSDEWPDVTIEGNVLATTENLTIPIDYDDPGTGSVGDPPEGTSFVTQADVDNCLATQGWTAFKHIEYAYNALPQFIRHTVTFNIAAGVHRPKPNPGGTGASGSAWLLNSSILTTTGKLIFAGPPGSQYESIDASLEGLSIQSYSNAGYNPSLTFSGTPFSGFDLRGYYVVLSTGQIVLIHDHTDSVLYVINTLSPAPTGGTVTIGKPAVVFKNTLNDIAYEYYNTGFVIYTNSNAIDLVNGITVSDLRFNMFGTYGGLTINGAGAHWVWRCLVDLTEDDLNSNGDGFTGRDCTIFALVYCSRIAINKSADLSVYCQDCLNAYIYFSFFRGGQDGIYISGLTTSLALMAGTVLDDITSSSSEPDGTSAFLRLTGGMAIDLPRYGAGKQNEIRNVLANVSGIFVSDGSRLRDGGYKVQMNFKNCAGPCIMTGRRGTFVVGTNGNGVISSESNSDVGIELKGPFAIVSTSSLDNLTGSVGDVRISDGSIWDHITIHNYSGLRDSIGNLINRL